MARAGACGTTGTGATTTGRGATRAFGVVERGVLRVVARADRVVVDVAVGSTSATFWAAGPGTAVGAGGAVVGAGSSVGEEVGPTGPATAPTATTPT